jgi:guanylate kinase
MTKKVSKNNSFCGDGQNVMGKMVRDLSHPLCIVLSSPSGGGKTTLCARLLGEFPAMMYSISCTTRAPRPGEVEGNNYYFLAEPEFKRRVKAGFFLEYARVHEHWYGTPKEPIETALKAGRDVLLAIDVQGAERIRSLISGSASDILKASFVDVFIVPPSLDVLKRRLEGRGQDTAETIATRLAGAEKELACIDQFKHVLVNERLDAAYDRLRAIIKAEHERAG